jgi:hypothetical protein
MTPFPVCSMSRDKGRGRKKSQSMGEVKELTEPRLVVAGDASFSLYMSSAVPPPCRSFASSINRNSLRRLLPSSNTRPLDSYITTLSKKPKDETTAPYPPHPPDIAPLCCLCRHHTPPRLSIITARQTSLVWASCRTHHAPVAGKGKTPGGKRGAVCTAKVCISPLQCPAHGSKLQHIAPQPYSAGLRPFVEADRPSPRLV